RRTIPDRSGDRMAKSRARAARAPTCAGVEELSFFGAIALRVLTSKVRPNFQAQPHVNPLCDARFSAVRRPLVLADDPVDALLQQAQHFALELGTVDNRTAALP